ALPQDVDKALQGFGMSMGPFAMHDLVGLDLGWRERKQSGQSRDTDKVADALCEAGRYGQKNGAGFYRYEAGNRHPLPDETVTGIVEQVSLELGINRREITQDEIIKRCIYALINEGAKILQEGIAIRGSDIDIVYIYGYGFPAWRGGPMFHADQIGMKRLLEDLEEMRKTLGPHWEPAALLQELAESEGKLSQWQCSGG
ncbi:MAG: 3-hydroxyacyl-CoA dehydrogenase family protein, partial [Ketobacteraceae bacterium]|nr:3-hydroxyacyl-CoA dehydrogenase family protein [Ketobacteraceae bacterium]